MWYEGVAEDGSRSIGMAVSDDGISGWKRWDRFASYCFLSHCIVWSDMTTRPSVLSGFNVSSRKQLGLDAQCELLTMDLLIETLISC